MQVMNVKQIAYILELVKSAFVSHLVDFRFCEMSRQSSRGRHTKVLTLSSRLSPTQGREGPP